MKRMLVIVLVIAAVGAGLLYGRRADTPATDATEAKVATAPPALVGATLLDGLGDYRFQVSSTAPEVQRTSLPWGCGGSW